ncbi:MAG: ferredoxin [Desulfobulbus sp.]|nr:ferredoxin [Desulfobulbus sp.]
MSKCVRIDQEECLGCEACIEICPSVFAWNEALGKAYVQNETSEEECVDEAIASCPAGCIHKDA